MIHVLVINISPTYRDTLSPTKKDHEQMAHPVFLQKSKYGASLGCVPSSFQQGSEVSLRHATLTFERTFPLLQPS